ncbi:MAG: site-2 protease family protein [Candidatus Pacearchaeota archaeon]
MEKIIIISGFILMIIGIYLIYTILKIFIFSPETYTNLVKAPPIFPLVPYFTEIFKIQILPPFYFTYWIIIIAIASISHEFFHGIFFKKENVRIKSTGFAFLGPFLAAFVDPEEKDIKKMKNSKQLAATAAGTFANLIVGIFFIFISVIFIHLTFTPMGATITGYGGSYINVSSIDKITNNTFIIDNLELIEIKANNKSYFIDNSTLKKILENNISIIPVLEDSPALKNKLRGYIIEINGEKIKDSKELEKILKNYSPGEKIKIKTLYNNTIEDYEIILANHPLNSTKPYIGISSYQIKSNFISKIIYSLIPFIDYKPKFAHNLILFIKNLLFWIILINIGMAFFNMVPCSVLDGGRFFYVSILILTKSKKFAEKFYKIVSSLILFIFLVITFIWFFISFFK